MFTSESDTEVLLKGYQRWGLNVLQRVRGMFAFVLWDVIAQRLIVVRDPVGIKPIYYTKERHFACASETSALVSANLVDPVVSQEGLDSFLAFGSVVAPNTIWRDVHALLPGHYLVVEPGKPVSDSVCYWDWQQQGKSQNLTETLSQSLDRHLVSDVPVALFLSGGYDSTAIASVAVDHSLERLHAFTLDFAGLKHWSEGSRALTIANRLGMKHHTVSVSAKDVLNNLPPFFSAMDQPSDDGLNTMLISQAVANQGYKVALHGVGGDELFGGYPSFSDVSKMMALRSIPYSIRRMLARFIGDSSIARSKLSEILRTDISILSAFLIRRRSFSFLQRRLLLDREPPLGEMGVPQPWLERAMALLSGCQDTFSAISHMELALYAANKLLIDGDVMSMSNGLEVRFPLLDVDLVSGCNRLPTDLRKANKQCAKPALANAVHRFPHDLMSRRKQGFTLPLEHWMRCELRDQVRNIFDQLPKTFGFNRAQLDKELRQFDRTTGGTQWLRIWQLFVLGSWMERHLFCEPKRRAA